MVLQSSSSFSFSCPHFSLICFFLLSRSLFMQIGKSPSICLSFCLLQPSLACLSLPLISLCLSHAVDFSLSSLHSFFLVPFSRTAHSCCDVFFDCHFSIWFSTSSSMSWCLIRLRETHYGHDFCHNLTFD